VAGARELASPGLVEALFPPPVICLQADPADWDAVPHHEDAALLHEAGPKRRREFAVGRRCARKALRRLDLPDDPIPLGPDGAPQWPSGAVGSISHCPGLCVAAVAPAACCLGIGVDVERAGRASQRLLERITSPSERRRLAELPAPPQGDWPTLLFAAKEALYKCVAPRVREPLRFRDALVSFDPVGQRMRATRTHDSPGLPPVLEGWYRASRTHVAVGVVRWRSRPGV